LTISAPTGGTVFSPPIEQDGRIVGRLPSWSGRPLEPENVGALLAKGVLICQIGDPQHLEAVLAVDQSQMEFLQPGQRVEVVLNQFPGRSFRTELEEISERDVQSTPHGASGGFCSDRATHTYRAGREHSPQPTYMASCTIDDPDRKILIGAKGRALISAGHQTLAQRIHRYIVRTFNART
jgi:putative peptide zinc metalloprotease protein